MSEQSLPELSERRQPVHPLLPGAVELHQAGRLAEAARVYEQIIAAVPGDFEATHLLGVIALQEGNFERARSLIAGALLTNPQNSIAWNNLGNVSLHLGQAETARAQIERALEIDPNSVEALFNLGATLRTLGLPAEAVVPLQRVHSIAPVSAAVCDMLGASLLDSGDVQGAIGIYELGVRAAPNHAGLWTSLAVASKSAHEYSRAQECAEKAVEVDPQSSNARAALAAIYYELAQIDSSLAAYRAAVELPDVSAKTLVEYANVLVTAGLNASAMEFLERAIAAGPGNAVARWKLSMANLKAIYDNEEEVLAARQAFSVSLTALAAWYRANPVSYAYTAVAMDQPFFLAYQAINNKELLGQYGKMCREWMFSLQPESRAVKRDEGAKIRIGIASAHIRDHSVWNAITKGWLENLDPAKFEICLFQLGDSSDEETIRAKALAGRFEDRPRNLIDWIRAIQTADLDALIYPEIGMDPLSTQLASLRLAPLQLSAWGHPETTGLPTIDLYLSAEAFEPENAQENYSERIVKLPNLGVYVEPLTPPAAKLNLRSVGLRTDMALLLCAGTPFKYMPASDKIWVAIAKGLPPKSNARLVFFRSSRKLMSDMLEQRLRKAFESEALEFDAHVCIIQTLDRKRFFALMQKSAIMLDTIGFSGFNTALQGIECGLPVLAREGDFMRSRLASAIMRRIGMPELVARNDDEFIQMAIQLAGDASLRKQLRQKIVDRRSVLFRDLEPVRALERCLVEETAHGRRRQF
jgi:protein O-GlcNAc transferase